MSNAGIDAMPQLANTQIKQKSEVVELSRRGTLLYILSVVCFVEGAVSQLLPSAFRALEADIELSPSFLSLSSFCQAVASGMSALICGSLIDGGFCCKRLLASGSAMWGICTFMLAFTQDLRTLIVLRMMNGAALATLSPVMQILISDLTLPAERGRYFGLCGCSVGIGAFMSCILTTMVSNEVYAGAYHGWRVAFIVVAGLSLAVSAMVAAFMPSYSRNTARIEVGTLEALESMTGLFEIGSFRVIVLQGCFACLPWSALSFATMLYQYEGITDTYAGVLAGTFIFCGSIGSIIGGTVSDWLVSMYPVHGRPLAAQISSFCGIPLAFVFFWLVPRTSSSFPYYLVLNCMLGLLATWCENGTNRPLLVEVVPATHRARVITLVSAIKSIGSLGALAAAMLAGKWFHYTTEAKQMIDIPEDVRIANANALANALLCLTTIPWTFCFMCYGLLQIVYPQDVRRQDASRGESQYLLATDRTVANQEC